MPSTQVPERFRPKLDAIVSRIVAGDFEGLVRDGLADQGVDHWVVRYPARVAPLPPEAWDISSCGEIGGSSSDWWVVIPLWTVEEGRSDLALEATVRERGGEVAIKVDGIHVM